MKSIIILSCILLTLPCLASAEIHQAVQDSLDYQLPGNTCSRPRIIMSGGTGGTVTPPPQAAGSTEFFVGSSGSEVSEMDSYTRKRLKSKERRWRKCVASYKAILLQDMEVLKGSATYGVTQAQANIILTNLALIQKVYMTEDGVFAD
ncbi:MAG: hypothetical protein OSB45_07215 [Pseudomonadales bacterium]|nr:hypothetical protein [Pseudomonadales bacterium]